MEVGTGIDLIVHAMQIDCSEKRLAAIFAYDAVKERLGLPANQNISNVEHYCFDGHDCLPIAVWLPPVTRAQGLLETATYLSSKRPYRRLA